MLRAPHRVQGADLARAEQAQEPEQAAALAAQELVDQVEAVQGEAVHRLSSAIYVSPLRAILFGSLATMGINIAGPVNGRFIQTL